LNSGFQPVWFSENIKKWCRYTIIDRQRSQQCLETCKSGLPFDYKNVEFFAVVAVGPFKESHPDPDGYRSRSNISRFDDRKDAIEMQLPEPILHHNTCGFAGVTFGATGEVFFRRVEGTSASLYRVQQDGGELRKAVDQPFVGLMAA